MDAVTIEVMVNRVEHLSNCTLQIIKSARHRMGRLSKCVEKQVGI